MKFILLSDWESLVKFIILYSVHFIKLMVQYKFVILKSHGLIVPSPLKVSPQITLMIFMILVFVLQWLLFQGLCYETELTLNV